MSYYFSIFLSVLFVFNIISYSTRQFSHTIILLPFEFFTLAITDGLFPEV